MNIFKRYFARTRDYIRQRIDTRDERPRNKVLDFLFVFMNLVWVVVACWVTLLLPSLDIESARWALSAQAQATAAILGLLIAAWTFRLRNITSQEEQLRGRVLSYLEMSNSRNTDGTLDIEIVYQGYLDKINSPRGTGDKLHFENLGRLWTIVQLSCHWGERTLLPRYFKHGQLKELSKVSKVAKECAVKMLDNYRINIAEFILDMSSTLGYVGEALTNCASRLPVIDRIRANIRLDASRLMSEEIRIIRSGQIPLFYATCIILSLAVIVGLCVLTGLGDFYVLTEYFGAYALMWLVVPPIALSVLGIYLCMGLVFIILR